MARAIDGLAGRGNDLGGVGVGQVAGDGRAAGRGRLRGACAALSGRLSTAARGWLKGARPTDRSQTAPAAS
eukprot:15465452-Alexandrium_andersonii.AAC.1